VNFLLKKQPKFGMCEAMLGEYGRAHGLLVSALDILRKKLGADHIEVADVLSTLGDVCMYVLHVWFFFFFFFLFLCVIGKGNFLFKCMLDQSSRKRMMHMWNLAESVKMRLRSFFLFSPCLSSCFLGSKSSQMCCTRLASRNLRLYATDAAGRQQTH
jgi:hypothetical protein